MPIGCLTGLLITGVLVALTLKAPRRPRWLVAIGHCVAATYNEACFPGIYLIVVSSVEGIESFAFVVRERVGAAD